MEAEDEVRGWAAHTFGGAALGDRRRSARLVSMAAQAAERPCGTVTGVFCSSAEREGAFRWLESPQVSSAAVAAAMFATTARQCASETVVPVAVDGSSLTLTDRARRREVGRVGNGRVKSRGLQVMTSLALQGDGVVVGLLDQRFWARDKPIERRRHSRKCFGQRYRQTETCHWVDALTACDERLKAEAPQAQPWFQLDRGADCWPVLKWAVERGRLLTVRARSNRRLVGSRGRVCYLDTTVKRAPVLGGYSVELAAQPGQPPRVAHILLRACPVSIHARVSKKRREELALFAVLAEETGRHSDRLRWLLLTTHPVATLEQAHAVVDAYALRWRIEDFHRAWKRGGCNVEDTQLHSRNALIKWATILAAVAARALRLAQLVRTTPNVPASTEFTPYEIAAAFLLSKRKRDKRKRLSLQDVVDLIADLGGFAHKYDGGRPGPTVLARGLAYIEPVARALQIMDEM